ENARSQHRPQFEADRKCHPAEGFQPWSLVGNAQWPAWIGRTKRSGPVAQALKVAKRGRTPAHTQNTSAFFAAHDVNETHEQKELRTSVRCIVFDAKP